MILHLESATLKGYEFKNQKIIFFGKFKQNKKKEKIIYIIPVTNKVRFAIVAEPR